MAGKEIRTQNGFTDGGLDERNVRKKAAAETYGFVNFPPGTDASAISASKSWSGGGDGGAGAVIRENAYRCTGIHQEPYIRERIG